MISVVDFKTRIYTYPPIPVVLISKSDDKVSENTNNDIRDESRQTHLWLSDTPVLLGGSHGDPVRQRSIGSQSNHRTGKTSKIGEADRLAGPVIGRGTKGLSLREVGREETTGRPRNHKSSIFNNWEPE